MILDAERRICTTIPCEIAEYVIVRTNGKQVAIPKKLPQMWQVMSLEEFETEQEFERLRSITYADMLDEWGE